MTAHGLGLLACLLAVVLLRQGWRQRGGRRILWLAAAGMAFGVAVIAFVATSGWAAGVCVAVMLGGVAGFAVTFAARERRPRRPPTRQRAARVAERMPGSRRRAWLRGVTAALLTLVAAEAITSGMATVLPGPAATRFAALVVLAPILWAGLIVWILGDPRLRRPLTGMTGAIAASLVLIAIGVLA